MARIINMYLIDSQITRIQTHKQILTFFHAFSTVNCIKCSINHTAHFQIHGATGLRK